jgi:membrane associated rhomboid family serine protease
VFDEFKNAFSRHNNAHVQLILINVVVFLFTVVLYVFSYFGGFEDLFTLIFDQFSIPTDFSEFITRPWTIITYAFAHSYTRILHILGNMLALYWFGKLLVEYLGSEKLTAIYILGALSGAIIFLIAFNTIPKLSDFPNDSMVGASGAVYAVMVAAATLLPDYTFFLIFIGPVRIKYIALFFIVGSLIGTTSSNAGGNLAHLGGALMGFTYIKQLQAGVNWGGWITATLSWFKSLFTPSSKVKVTYRKSEPRPAQSAPASKMSKASQDEIDAILDKISDRGYESLSKEEKEKLFNASKK